ncbi:DUF1304 domain-containing protein [Acaricomes phytoseiuli]|uniref:DUF1304 domain-containing protein n=1 Tax=Acaricomes phytoseiuli TaxID=291968 RepID=UPI002223D3EA|nr:DUF1304 domain-containing protein [Acaricomes phytoseiuli]MCW1250683.1 DUF1304 domain-containing protein [Acaricomes phytoseiuli]
MIILGLIFCGIAALIHVYIFYLESIAWLNESTRKTFGITFEEAEATRAMAFNQGFYNLFLAISVFLGIFIFSSGSTAVGTTLIGVGAGSMVAAGVVLVASDRSKTSAALKQFVPPLLGLISLAIGSAIT